MQFNDAVAYLTERLNRPLPGEAAQYKMAPVQRKSRDQYLSEFPEYRSSSVLILIYPDLNAAANTLLIKRPGNSGVHSSQIAFPGGKIEPDDASPAAAAMREANEEVGVDPALVSIAGQLSPLFIPVSRFMVHPFIGFAHSMPDFKANPDEVNMLLPTPLSKLMELQVTNNEYNTSMGKITAPGYRFDDHIIWGATAMMISEFRALLEEY